MNSSLIGAAEYQGTAHRDFGAPDPFNAPPAEPLEVVQGPFEGPPVEDDDGDGDVDEIDEDLGEDLDNNGTTGHETGGAGSSSGSKDQPAATEGAAGDATGGARSSGSTPTATKAPVEDDPDLGDPLAADDAQVDEDIYSGVPRKKNHSQPRKQLWAPSGNQGYPQDRKLYTGAG